MMLCSVYAIVRVVHVDGTWRAEFSGTEGRRCSFVCILLPDKKLLVTIIQPVTYVACNGHERRGYGVA